MKNGDAANEFFQVNFQGHAQRAPFIIAIISASTWLEEESKLKKSRKYYPPQYCEQSNLGFDSQRNFNKWCKRSQPDLRLQFFTIDIALYLVR
jgi:hypothetical protein